MFYDLLANKNNIQLQLNDFEDEESIKLAQMAILKYKSKNKSLKSGCKRCGSYGIIGWGGYSRKVRHMYNPTEHIRAKRFRCKTCGKTVTVLPEGVRYYKRFADRDYLEMVDQRCSRGSGYRRLSRRGKIRYCSHVTMWRKMQETGQRTLDAFFDLAELPFSGIAVTKVFPDAIRQNCIFHIKKNIRKEFRETKFEKLSDEALKAREEILSVFNAENSEEAIRRLAILVEEKHTLPPMARHVVDKLVSKIESLFHYLDYDISQTTNQAEQTFSLFQPIIDAAKSFSTGVGNFFRTIMLYKNFHFFSSGPRKDKNIMQTIGVDADSMFDFIKLP